MTSTARHHLTVVPVDGDRCPNHPGHCDVDSSMCRVCRQEWEDTFEPEDLAPAAQCEGCGDSALKAFPPDEALPHGVSYVCMHCVENAEPAAPVLAEPAPDGGKGVPPSAAEMASLDGPEQRALTHQEKVDALRGEVARLEGERDAATQAHHEYLCVTAEQLRAVTRSLNEVLDEGAERHEWTVGRGKLAVGTSGDCHPQTARVVARELLR